MYEFTCSINYLPVRINAPCKSFMQVQQVDTEKHLRDLYIHVNSANFFRIREILCTLLLHMNKNCSSFGCTVNVLTPINIATKNS